MNDDKKQLMDDQYHILHINRTSTRLEKLGTTHVYPKGFIFDFREKEPDAIYYIKRGRIIAYEDSYDGDHRIYNIMSSGSLFLEEYVLFPRTCPVLFKTLTDSELLKIHRCDLIRAFKSDVDVTLDILDSVCNKFCASMETQRIGIKQDAEWKLCRMLISTFENYGRAYKDGMILNEKVSHQLLADLLGMNRVTVSRKFKKLRDLGLISQESGHLYLPDIDAFLTYMDQLEFQSSTTRSDNESDGTQLPRD